LYNTENDIIGLCAIIHFPHPKKNNIVKYHRIVILPDYQGIGLGSMMLSEIGKLYKNKRYDLYITTTLKNFAKSLSKSKKFVCIRCNIAKPSKSCLATIAKKLRKVKTATLAYIGG
jgi:GNAT superfamily N-acetyltransferase